MKIKQRHDYCELRARTFACLGLALALATTGASFVEAGQDSPDRSAPQGKVREGDVKSLESILDALYDSISGPAGPRDWDRLRGLFISGARLIPAVHKADGVKAARVLTVDEFIKASEPRLKEEGFFEREVHRSVQHFGAVAHVFSTYESRHSRSDARPFVRGINSIQLFHDGKRWWVVTIFWDSERPDQQIPAEYAPGP